MTLHGDICQTASPTLVLRGHMSEKISFMLHKVNRLLYMPIECILNSLACKNTVCNSSSSNVLTKRSWPDIKAIIDRFHLHVCGHSDYSDMKTLLARNDLWNDNAQDYLKQIMSICRGCRSMTLPQPSRKVSLRSLDRTFNQVICIDHMYLGDQCTVHVMDTKTRFSTGVICNDTSLAKAVYAFQGCWLTPFWSPEAIRGDEAFNQKLFTDFTESISTKF